MKKNKKKWIIILSAAFLAAILAFLLIFKPFGKKTIDVYPVSEIVMNDYSDSFSEMTGSVRAEGFQSIRLSSTQTVNEIYVQKGQHVEAGDALLSYDTTLTDIAIEKANLDVQKKKLELEKAYAELNEINSLVPSSEVLVEPDNSWIHYDPVTTPYLLTGTGTEDDPMYFVIDNTNLFSTSFFRELLPEGTEKLFVVLLIREHNAVNGKIEESFGFEIYCTEEDFSFKPFEPVIPESIIHYDQPEEPYYEHEGSDYTAAEIVLMRSQQEAKIRDLELHIQVSQLEYEKKVKESSDNVVRAVTAGTVKLVRDPEAASQSGEPVIQISAGGGFYVDVAVGELMLDTVRPGMKVSVSKWDGGDSMTGTVESVSDMPVDNNGYFSGSGNQNVSYYPLTISIPEDAPLAEGDMLTVTADDNTAAGSSFYIENMFLLRENGKTYVFVKGENDRLEKREVQPGKDLYGSETEIKEGLTKDDLIAFPYGKNVKAGAPVRIESASSLYNY
ncbi:MAG: HlyD family efflux transporter periplasmic adaptor subunit [Parasporobacterium sp.]|nr:HlyD family efflux transporter periplasmic adaptor subunit [Parasporobacterium sp.]